ncbi:DUF2301 domain-containing membrane protein [Vibrio sp. PNB23_22_6]|jgi:uncharacterized integral membrane protein|uniref:DUF2301 domain-containing membrane protein n=1 Tax=Vibrio TaxID=662 RepID=UPI000E688C4B|nr:DUF2301 domain-containing membrane protein [Vibrio sp. PID23_8]RIZ55295.1 hypothetical protein AK966_08180 [Vibrio sp. PID23_8]
MANIEHQETLDSLDKLSVCLYRLGISLFALTLMALSMVVYGAFLQGYQWTITGICVAGALSAANVHIYSKRVRVVICWSSWIGLVLLASDFERSLVWLALGFIFVTFSGIALKESFCFKVPGLKLVPVLLAIATFSIWYELSTFAALSLLIAGVIMGYLSILKWRMPLHFDIGIKDNYEV